MSFDELKAQIELYKRLGKRMFTTCSFQSHSLVLLHMLSRIDNELPVYFINTGYLFPETVAFKDEVSMQFGLQNVIDLRPLTPKYMQRDGQGRLFFTHDPDHCCDLNKVQPMETVLHTHDVWINGVRADQSAARKAMKRVQEAKNGCVRFHPMLEWTPKMIYEYQREYNLPKHPMEARGYWSIGCEPCTRKPDLEMQEREARWFGLNKTECGLNTDLIKH